MNELLISIPDICRQHIPGDGWPERPERLDAVFAAVADDEIASRVKLLRQAHPVAMDDLLRVHSNSYVSSVRSLCERGGGPLDPETFVSAGSFDAAVAAAGAGLHLAKCLLDGQGLSGFVAARPPGHHALPYMGMGFCVFNNVAITAASLAASGQRVAIIDWDVHHGNGTQQVFWNDPAVLYASLHESPLFPDTGNLREVGGDDAEGLTVNLPLPSGATGDVYVTALTDVVAPLVHRFEPDWVLISAGFDAHRDDGMSGMRLLADDFGALTNIVLGMAPAPDRMIMFLEGGYNLRSLESSFRSTISALLGIESFERPATTGGRGMDIVAEARAFWGLNR